MKLVTIFLALVCVVAFSLISVSAVMAQDNGEDTASFQVSELVVQPRETTVGREVTISADVTNVGNASGIYIATLTVNGQQVNSSNVSLAPAQTGTVEFKYTPPDAGTYAVGVGDQQTLLEVSLATEAKFRTGPTVRLRPVTDDITASQDGLVELFLSNPSLNDVTLNGDMYVSVPSGIHVYGQGFGEAGAAGIVYGQFSIPPGTARTIYMNIKADETSAGETHFVHFEGLYYPDENKDAFNPISLTHPFTVKEASPDPYDPSLTNPEQIEGAEGGGIWMGWWVIIAVVVLGGIATIVAVMSRRTEVTIEK